MEDIEELKKDFNLTSKKYYTVKRSYDKYSDEVRIKGMELVKEIVGKSEKKKIVLTESIKPTIENRYLQSDNGLYLCVYSIFFKDGNPENCFVNCGKYISTDVRSGVTELIENNIYIEFIKSDDMLIIVDALLKMKGE